MQVLMRARDGGGSDAPQPARQSCKAAEVRAVTCTKIAIELANMNPRKRPGPMRSALPCGHFCDRPRQHTTTPDQQKPKVNSNAVYRAKL